MNCVTLAGGIVMAAGQLKLSVPLIVRMEGTNVHNGKKTSRFGQNKIIADSLEDAAKKAVVAAPSIEGKCNLWLFMVDETTRVITQGITPAKPDAFHTEQCLQYGTQMVGGVTPGTAERTF